MNVILILFIFIIVEGFLIFINIDANNEDLRMFIGLLLVISGSICTIIIYETLIINPIEVYRGNTELEITYKNNIPIDTVVVWKNK